MLKRSYWAMWVIGLALVGAFYFTGNMTSFAATVFGFISFGLVFMGMMFVLPFTVTHPAPENKKGKTEPFPGGFYQSFREWFHGLRASWMSSSSVEAHRPPYR